jgi:hypothetical protein
MSILIILNQLKKCTFGGILAHSGQEATQLTVKFDITIKLDKVEQIHHCFLQQLRWPGAIGQFTYPLRNNREPIFHQKTLLDKGLSKSLTCFNWFCIF